jgi:anti-sigma regulatory factor (Ser/Thr protein kinase)
MVSLLWDAGEVVAAIELESLWNDLGDEVPFSLYCAYRADSVFASGNTGALRQVCELHSSVLQAPVSPRPVAMSPLAEAANSAHFQRSIDSPRAARHFVVEQMQSWGWCDPGLLDDAALVITELAANAVVHAQSEFTVILSTGRAGVRIAVHDNEAVDEARLIVRTGRGLGLVSRLSRSWGADRTDEGKLVWAILTPEDSGCSNIVVTR